MIYPTISEYIESIKYAEDNFATLTNLRPVLDKDGVPVMSSGNFAVVFKMQDIETNDYFAVKCFTREQEGREEAYKKIAEQLSHYDSSYIVSLKFLKDELFVNCHQSDKSEFSLVVMQWVEGNNLEKYISEHFDDAYAIHHIFGAFLKMAIWLLQQPFAHGDLKPDNILVREDGTIALVDYDGMFVPSMEKENSRELGSPDFRHPQRNHNEFNDSIDVFAIASIALALSHIAKQSQSVREKKFFFLTEQDHIKPNESKLLKEVLKNSIGTVCGKMLSLYHLSLSDNYLHKSTFLSFLLSVYTEDTKITEFDYNNSFSIGHVRYSFDARKILEIYQDYMQRNQAFEIKQGVEILCDESLNNLDDNGIIIIPKSLSLIGEKVFPHYVRRFISLSPNFIDDEYGLFSADYNELIKTHESSKTILRLYPDTSIIRDNAVSPYSDTLFSYVEKNSAFYRLNHDWDGRIGLEAINDLYEDLYGAVYTKDKKTLLHFPIYSHLREYSIIEGCETIDEGAFAYFVGADDDSVWIEGNSIETLHFPNSLQHIKINGILGCINLRNIFVDIYAETSFRVLLENYDEENYGSRKFKLNGEMFIYETESTKYDKENSFIDEFGFRYTNDGLKLLSAKDTHSLYLIRDGVKIICNDAFYLIDCPNLILPNSLVSIGDSAFCDCSFTEINVPKNVKSIGSEAFMGEGLKSITINGCIRYMGRRIFSPDDNGSRLEKVNLCDGILALGDLTFDCCYNLKEIVLPSTLLSIGDNPFANSGITNVINESDNFVIKNDCLYRKWSDKLISYFGSGQNVSFSELSEIGNHAFAGNSNLLSITISNGVTNIGGYAFERCTNLLYLEIPESVISIGKCAFQSCHNLEKVILPKNILVLKEMTFNACRSLRSIILPMYLIKIENDAFKQCPSLKTVELPAYLNEIDGNPFVKDYSGLGVSSITCKSNRDFFVYDGGLYHNKLKTLVTVFGKQDVFHIKEGTKLIGDNAFNYCQNIRVVDIPASVTIIGDYGFWGCKRLQHIILRENIEQIYHPNSMFEYCESLQHIYIENNDYLFHLLYNSNAEYRNKLKKIENTTVLPNDWDNAISFPGEECNCYDDKKRMISYGYNYRDSYKIREGTRIICDECFFDEFNEIDGYYLRHLHIPKSVEFIGENPFCGSITSIECDSPHFIVEGNCLLSADRKKLIFYFGQERVINIPEGIEVIGSGSFCSREFDTLTIPSSVRQIGDNPFINSVAIVDSLGKTRANTYRIISNSSLFNAQSDMLIDNSSNKIISYWGNDKTLIIPRDIKAIGANAFFGAEFDSVELHRDIEFIDEKAFYWCFNLDKVIIPKGREYEMKKLLSRHLKERIVGNRLLF